MDHTVFLASLSDEEKSRLTEKSDGPAIIHLFLHVALIIGCGGWIAAGGPGWQLLLPVQGVLITFLFTLEHEATHQTPFRTPWLNEGVGRVAGLLIFLPFQWFRYFHLAHHRYTNDPERDPELSNPKPETWAQFAKYISGISYWRGVSSAILRNAVGRSREGFIPASAHGKLNREARWMMMVYALAALSLFFSEVLIWIWLVPLLLGQPFLRIYLLAEHGRCPPVANMFENTRTTFTNRVVRFLAWNMPYHAEHHAYPQVPFHKLPALHAKSLPYLKETTGGYVQATKDHAKTLRG
ncbi:MAG: fatty acid desaturase [Boseongicola sp.]|nr:fatty acid desaturase [Boseongicola sp.]MDD9977665.1 fatty acid desaturase [Boseongicola sp.]